MEEGTVASVLMQDFEAHAEALQFGAFAVTAALATVGAFLAVRAYAILTEARALYWANHQTEQQIKTHQQHLMRRARSETIASASMNRKKKPARRSKTVV